jgi:2-oxo-4-hydroxy-4-carboxy-5-ureidoimidazoline decarboxylase
VAEPQRTDPAPFERLNQLSDAEARGALQRCCGASRWVDAMLAARPFASPAALARQADAAWAALETSDFLEAFSHHPEIGADLNELRKRFAATAQLSLSEQAGAVGASDATLAALRQLNQAYRTRFGYSFIVCASGKTAEEMRSLLEQRLGNPPQAELLLAAAEQAQITRLRLEKI